MPKKFILKKWGVFRLTSELLQSKQTTPNFKSWQDCISKTRMKSYNSHSHKQKSY